jgi:hypothetical protein
MKPPGSWNGCNGCTCSNKIYFDIIETNNNNIFFTTLSTGYIPFLPTSIKGGKNPIASECEVLRNTKT